jgi:serine/threonine protein kinase
LDIKPQNLVVFPGGKIKLVDLGIAQKAYQQRYISLMFFSIQQGHINYNK